MENYGPDDELFGLDETCLDDDFKDEISDNEILSIHFKYNEILFQRLKTSLAGVPPPPVLTYPGHSVEEILRLWTESLDLAESQENNKSDNSQLNEILFSGKHCSLDSVLNSEWPDVKYCLYHDINYNLGNVSEKIVDLFDKYRERFVGCETSSFINISSPVKQVFNRLKDKQNKKCNSPGQRLSHLAKRRTVFSSASLKAAGNSSTTQLKHKTILVSSKNLFGDKKRNPKRALFVSPDEKNKITNYIKCSPSKLKSLQMKRSLWLKNKFTRKNTPTKLTPKKNITPKKITPNKQTPKKSNTPKKTVTPSKKSYTWTPKKSVTPNKNKYSYQTKIFLNEAYQSRITDNGKRLRLDKETESSNTSLNSSSSKDSSREESKSLDLSDTQRRKLLWAVSSALKDVGVRTNHKYFRLYGKKLYKLCKNFWINRFHNKTPNSGTSEFMMSLASEHVADIIKEVDSTNTDTSEFFSQDSCDFFFKKYDNTAD